MRRLQLLVLSVGSLVGQNILDALEGRRHLLHVIGANHGADNPRLFRCDEVFLTPRTDDAPAFRARLREIIAQTRPDLILAGRDHDVPFMGELFEEQPALAHILPCGPRRLADVMQDKWESHLFCQRHHLPFADTFLSGPHVTTADIRAFAGRHAFPFIAKPRYGYGTIGVRVLLDESQLLRAARRPDYVIQPFLAPPPDLANKFFDPADGWPYFHMLIDEGQYAGQVIIGPDGQLASEPWCHLCTIICGKPEKIRPHPDPAFQDVTRRFALAMASEGWRGPFNVQCRRVAEGQFIGFEMNGRNTGTTSPRRLCGFDEIGLLARAFAGMDLPPALPLAARAGSGFVVKTLADDFVPDAWARELEAEGVWRTLQAAE